MKDSQHAQVKYNASTSSLTSPSTEGAGHLSEFPADSAGCPGSCECDACRNDGYRQFVQSVPGGEYKPVEHTDARTTPVVSGDLEECLAAFIRRIIAEEAIHAQGGPGDEPPHRPA